VTAICVLNWKKARPQKQRSLISRLSFRAAVGQCYNLLCALWFFF